MKITTILIGLTAGFLLSASASAQAPGGPGTPGGAMPAAAGPQGGAMPMAAQQVGGTAPMTKIGEVRSRDVAQVDDPNSPVEKADQTYYFVGARFRYIIVPKFYMGIFGDGGTTVGAPAFGPEFTIRKNDFEYVMSAMYGRYSFDATPFKSKTDANDAWEIVDAQINTIYLMSDFLWSAPTSPKFAFTYGGGFGLGVVFGNIHRQQAYPAPGADVNDGYAYLPCVGQLNPHPYCGKDNDHYGDYSEASWANGGSKPLMFPWLSLQTGFRFKPTKQFMGRVDVGWNLLNGPFFGLALNYGLL